jgi:hypothetical protein
MSTWANLLHGPVSPFWPTFTPDRVKHALGGADRMSESKLMSPEPTVTPLATTGRP